MSERRIVFIPRASAERFAHADRLCAAAFECDLRTYDAQTAYAADLADVLAQSIARTVWAQEGIQ